MADFDLPPPPGRPRGPGRPKKVPVDPPPMPKPVVWTPLPGPVVPPEASPPPGLTPRQRQYFLSLLNENRKRQFESLKLYEPMPAQSAFHMSMARQRICRGSNRAGKTLATCVELAWAVTGQHPQPGKYPERDGRAIVVAKDIDKIGEVVWRKLGRAGAFKIVDDPILGWRAWRPATDEGGPLKPKPAPPLIPPRFIKDIAWESKKSNQPKRVILNNGWEISFYSSKSDPFTVQGVDVDIVMFDEEIVHHSWFSESIARLLDRKGRFWWGATPQTGTQQLFDLHLRAEAAAEDKEENPLVEEVFLSIWDNAHIEGEEKRNFSESLDEEERRVRIDGEFAITGLRVYEGRFFPKTSHGVDAFPIPHHWTRFAAIDPGAQVGAVLFGAVPPKKPDDASMDPSLFGEFLYLYDELYIRGCDAAKLAERMKGTIGDQVIHTFLIDHHGGVLREIGSGLLPEEQYKRAFKKAGVASVTTGHGFAWGSDDLDGGILRVKEFLRLREDGTPRVRVLRGRCTQLVKEMGRYQWKVVNGAITDKPLARGNHLVDCLRYLCQHPGLKFVAPKKARVPVGGAYDAWQSKREKARARKKAGGGPAVVLG